MNPLTKYLDRTGLSQTQFARQYGFPLTTINGWFDGTRRPSLDAAFRMEKATAGAIPASSWVSRKRAA
ncbi:MAG: helix-turn-helix transcriptional regulator [Deltaproteobacteria bacterium]